jgi:hypothetical protein
MKKIGFLALVISFIFIAVQFVAESFATKPPPPEPGHKPLTAGEVKKGFVEKGAIPERTQVEKSMNPESAEAQAIHFLATMSGSCQTVAKVFKDALTASAEYHALSEFQEIILLVNSQHHCNKNLPIICGLFTGSSDSYLKSEGTSAILLERAKGRTLQSYYDRIASMPTTEISKIFTSVGTQFGALDNFTYEGDEEVLTHGDSHAGNFMFDEATGQLYWIDIAGTKTVKAISKIRDLKFLYGLLNLYTPRKAGQLARDLVLSNMSLIPADKQAAAKNTFSVEALHLKFVLPYLQYIPQPKLDQFRGNLINLLNVWQKERLVVRSFGVGYIREYPAGKNDYNLLTKKEDEFVKQVHDVEKALKQPETQFSDLKIP